MPVALRAIPADALAIPPARKPRMARVKIRHFVELPGAQGPRYFWQPSSALRKAGWRPKRLADDRRAAIHEAEALNAELDAWRRGEAPAIAAPKVPATIRQPGTLGAVIADYKTSRFYPKNPKTRRAYLQNIAVIEEWAGQAPARAISKQRVEVLYAKLYAKTPSKANAVITMLRILLSHAMRLDDSILTNAAANPGLIGQRKTGRIWPREAVDLFVEVADHLGHHSVGTAVMVNHWLGQREADILAMPRTAYRNGWFMVRQNKTDARVGIPHSAKVKARVEQELQRQALRLGAEADSDKVAHPTLLVCETTGAAWKEDHFRHVFAEIRAAMVEEWPAFFLEDDTQVDTAKLWFMHLRHTAVTELAIVGCAVPQIAGITGHTPKSVEQILSRYLVRTAALAASATTMREAADLAREEGK